MSEANKTYRILSIDGGGIKGLYSATVIEKLEERYGPLWKHFNLICGTSTGGIIALAVASGVPAKTIVQFYKEAGPKIFHYKSNFSHSLRRFKHVIATTKYDNKELKLALERVFEERTIGDCHTNVLIPSVNMTKGRARIFKSDHVPTLTKDNQKRLVDVALATSAAPMFLPITSFETEDGMEEFVDGGLVANNPSLFGIQEYIRYYKDKGEYDDFSLLSLSTLHDNVKFELGKMKRRPPFIKWKDKLFSLMMDTQSESVHYHILFLLESIKGKYLRIPSLPLTKAEKRHIDLDKAYPKAISILSEKGEEVFNKYKEEQELINFFVKTTKEEPIYV
ncbi:CBASS cGAMP-activated phospholipase [Paenibacillus sp. 843]|uniref:CBASS cGAMP-activated phospholipase n=1 Tax=Paenibacillus sp. 843 TaxID=3341795 RepID=UPI003729653B